jgi:hypothetical protein
MKLHTGDGWQSGDVNCNQLTNSDRWHDGVKIETCDKTYKCGICGEGFSNDGILLPFTTYSTFIKFIPCMCSHVSL